MNTPGHAVFNLLVLGARERSSLFAPIAIGAIVPDLPMILFYAYEKSWLGTPERIIWSQSYYDVGWQAFFDLFNSIPILALAALVAYASKFPRLVALFASMGIHSICDLALHHDDAHRHFLPFSEWRFASPVSYWNPRYYGAIVFWIEIALVLIGATWLFKQNASTGARAFLAVLLGSYACYLGYVVVVWM